LSDEQKRKQYDMFWSAWNNPFSSYSSTSWWSPFEWFSGFSSFEDLFWNMWGNGTRSSSFEFNIEDLFWWTTGKTSNSSRTRTEKQQNTLDFEKTYEIPIFDLILGCKIEVIWVYWQKAKLTIPANTKPWTKFRVKDFWNSEWNKKWNLIVKVEAVMPKTISPVDLQLLKTIRDNVGY
jgi:DnaJ-class molecular chaperone